MSARARFWSKPFVGLPLVLGLLACESDEGGSDATNAPVTPTESDTPSAPDSSSPDPENTGPENPGSTGSIPTGTPSATTPMGDGGSPAQPGGVGGSPSAPTGTGGGTGADAGQPSTGGASGAGGVSATGGMDAGVDPCAIPEFVAPTLLSETGLYSDIAAGTLAQGVRPFAPRFELWSDGAVKTRYVYFPPCSQIDTTDPDYWNYPVGFKLWKQFVRDDAQGQPVRVETRLIQKYTATKWFMTAFIWNAEQTEAAVAPGDGVDTLIAAENASGTQHDVPGQKSCEGCHLNMLDRVLGFSALQLDVPPNGDFVTLDALEAEQLLTAPIAHPIVLPGTEAQAAALGYMHANCGTCHNPYSKQAGLNLQYWLELGALGSVEETPTYLTNVGQITQAPQQPPEQPTTRVVPQAIDESAVHWRMVQPPTFPTDPQGGNHMPLIGTEITDEVGLQLVIDWINSLDPVPETP